MSTKRATLMLGLLCMGSLACTVWGSEQKAENSQEGARGLGSATSATGPAATSVVRDEGFSFAVYGDSRPMMYLPYKPGDDKLHKVLVELFGVLGSNTSEEVVKREVKLVREPVTGDLAHIRMPLEGTTGIVYLTLDKGWVTEASVEDPKLLPGVRKTMFRMAGGDWVSREIVKCVQSWRARFVLNTGDIVWWGYQGHTVHDSPYWRRVNETVLKHLPPPDEEMLASGLEGRFFPSVGNHEVWGDPKIEGVLSTLAYLKKLGVSANRLIYKFDFKQVRFIFLWSGTSNYQRPARWIETQPNYATQMKQLKAWLDEAKVAGIRKAFIVFHYPIFCRSGFGVIPKDVNPHEVIASYAKELELVVLNGHIHTTEIYDVDGVKYLMLGGGGAEQDPIRSARKQITIPPDYPVELYWKGRERREEYNWVLVDVQPGQRTKFTLSRFRPWSAEPFATVELFGSSE